MIPTLISLVALVIAVLSFFIASERFRLDLYNKRFDIYVRTVKFYQILLKSRENDEDETFAALRKDFILACRESKFLFDPESGVYDLLNRLNMASFEITGSRDMPKGLPAEQIIENQRRFAEAIKLWISSMEPLEDLMAPYLNYHYASAPAELIGEIGTWWQKMRQRWSSSS
ncbi:MAG: hypothetical protein ACHQF3_03655 [Alphaproteobacteria bacterium]